MSDRGTYLRHKFYRLLVAAPLALPGIILAMAGKGYFHSTKVFGVGLLPAFALPLLVVLWQDRPRRDAGQQQEATGNSCRSSPRILPSGLAISRKKSVPAGNFLTFSCV